MTVVTRRDGTSAVVAFEGELDAATAPDLELELAAALRSDAETVVLDLRALVFLDSSGLRVILRARTATRQAGKSFELLRPEGAARRIFEVSGTD